MLRLALAALATLLLPVLAAAAPPAREAITADAIATELRHELEGKLPAGPIQLDLDNPSLRLFGPAGQPATLAIDNLTYDPRSGRLSAYVMASAESGDGEPVHVTGRVWRMIDLPVLTRPVAPGEPIEAKDVESISVRSERLTQNFVLSESELIGKTPRRAIRPGEPVRASDVQVPVVIRKGELVTLVLQAPGMMLTAQAKALADGTAGSPIRVANTRSNRIVEGVVSAPGTVTVVALAAAR